jgi:hypothetical protein
MQALNSQLVNGLRSLFLLLSMFFVSGCRLEREESTPLVAEYPTAVVFHSDDEDLQRLHDAAVARLQENLVFFTPGLQVLVEGGGYPNAWLETQPMGGEMFAKRNAQVALNNQLIFMMTQREDGRLPGMVVAGETARARGWDAEPPEGFIWMPGVDLLADFEMFQGFCFPEPAWRMYHWMGRDRKFLERLHEVLAAYDAYLWRTRDSNGDGILETWCLWDTGEDASSRFTTRHAPHRWPFEKPPGAKGMPRPENPDDLKKYWFEKPTDPPVTSEQVRVPFASMDVMAYSYSARATLARISAELDNGQEDRWAKKAQEVREKLIETLWDENLQACFDRDKDGNVLPELIHNNLRCMWYGIFTQEMADAFIHEHLLDPEAFWTPVPLPSIAIKEELFRNATRNNWSGQPQGLTYQRAIDALENYAHYAEVILLGEKLLPVLMRNGNRFTQQLDPMTGEPSGQTSDGYGPMALAALEYISRMHGIHLDVADGRVWWSAVDPEAEDFTYTQKWGNRSFRLQFDDGIMEGKVNGEVVFACTAGARVVTDLDGNLLEIVGIAPQTVPVEIREGGEGIVVTVEPNHVYRKIGKGFEIQSSVPFQMPKGTNIRF